MPDAQAQLATIVSAVQLAQSVEHEHCNLPHHQTICDTVRTAGYDAEAAYTTANIERTALAINEARLKTIHYTVIVMELVK